MTPTTPIVQPTTVKTAAASTARPSAETATPAVRPSAGASAAPSVATEPINIMFCGDANIADGILVSTLSLLRHTARPLRVFVVTASVESGGRSYAAVSDAFVDKLNILVSCCTPGSSAYKVDVTHYFVAQPPTANAGSYFTPCCMFRLYADLSPEIPDRVLYLDTDVVCRRDVSELYDTDIEEYDMAGVLDFYGRWLFRGATGAFDYLNSGVLLLNMRQIRDDGLFGKCRKMCADTLMFMPDQTALNKLTLRRKVLPRRFNEQRRLHDDTVLQHFTTSFRVLPPYIVQVKPWQIDKMHNVLNLHEYDDVLADYTYLKPLFADEATIHEGAEMTATDTTTVIDTAADAFARYAATSERPADADAKRGRHAARTDTREVIPVFFTIDDSYAPFLGVAVKSLIEHASRDYAYDIVIMYQSLSDKHRAMIEDLEQPGFNIRLIAMRTSIDGIESRTCNKLRQDYFTLTIFFRLFIPVMFPEYDKGIYLDSDIVVPGDISKLYETDLGDNLIGGCVDLSVQGVPELVSYIKEFVGVPSMTYINSGMLLMDLDKLRKAHLDERFMELLERYHFENLAPDQDYINVLCHGKIAYLDASWDAMPRDDTPEIEHPDIIHYNLFAKPWCYDDIQYEKYFWDEARDSAFYDEIVAFKENYTDEQRQSDTDCQIKMAVHGKELVQSMHGEGPACEEGTAPISFASVFNTGKEARL